MFRINNRNDKKGLLVCKVCKTQTPVPKHHDKDMVWTIEGAFRKMEYLKCFTCDKKIEMPLHCELPMFYSEVDWYLDMPDFSRMDLNIRNLSNKKNNS